MKKSIYLIFTIATVAIAIGCSKDKGGGGHNPYPPGYHQGGFPPQWQGPLNQAPNVCSSYDTQFEVFRPVYFQHIGVTLCYGYPRNSSYFSFGQPMYLRQYPNVMQGCVPGGYNRCACANFGGTAGWHADFGVCVH